MLVSCRVNLARKENVGPFPGLVTGKHEREFSPSLPQLHHVGEHETAQPPSKVPPCREVKKEYHGYAFEKAVVRHVFKREDAPDVPEEVAPSVRKVGFWTPEPP